MLGKKHNSSNLLVLWALALLMDGQQDTMLKEELFRPPTLLTCHRKIQKMLLYITIGSCVHQTHKITSSASFPCPIYTFVEILLRKSEIMRKKCCSRCNHSQEVNTYMGQGKDGLEVFAKFKVFQLMSTAKTYCLTIKTRSYSREITSQTLKT